MSFRTADNSLPESYVPCEEEYGEEHSDGDELTHEEKTGLCRAFTLLDVDGDGVIDPTDLENLLITWGRLPILDEEKEEILSYATGEGCEGAPGMDLEGFRQFLADQLGATRDENELRSAFEAFDSDPPEGKLNLVELRHHLKNTGLRLTDDEIDFLFREEDYWMLEEKYIFEYEELINKIMDKPINSPFLNF